MNVYLIAVSNFFTFFYAFPSTYSILKFSRMISWLEFCLAMCAVCSWCRAGKNSAVKPRSINLSRQPRVFNRRQIGRRFSVSSGGPFAPPLCSSYTAASNLPVLRLTFTVLGFYSVAVLSFMTPLAVNKTQKCFHLHLKKSDLLKISHTLVVIWTHTLINQFVWIYTYKKFMFIYDPVFCFHEIFSLEECYLTMKL